MRILCVDDERLLMEELVEMCLDLPEISAANGFLSAEEALEWLKTNQADIALLDINMPGMKGLELAAKIKELYPDTSVIFVTGYSQFAVDAFRARASGYLLKPVSKEALANEVAYIRSIKPKIEGQIFIKTFGSFDIFKDGQPIKFKIAKTKEILAYLVDRQGSSVTRAEISSVIWEERVYDRKQQKNIDVYIRSLKDTLAFYDISQIMEIQHGTLRVVPEKFVCDAYRFFAGYADAINAYRGEYMSQYSWASITEGLLFRKMEFSD